MKARELKEFLLPLDDETELSDLFILKPVKTCKNCGYKDREICLLSGISWDIERRFPSRCGYKYENWLPKQPKLGLFTKIKNYFK
jgi:hypothetical protein